VSFWTAARFEPGRGGLALRHLAAQGFEAYLPKIRERIITPHRSVERTTALFPGYLFVRIELQWRPVQMTLGIRALVMRGGEPARMQDHLIAAIRAQEHDGFVELPRYTLVIGDPVRIRRGALYDRIGFYAGMNGHQRAAVLMTLFGSEHKIMIPMTDIDVSECSLVAPPKRKPRRRPGRKHRKNELILTEEQS
jgi:transcriptional antiterminator RfaH